MPKPQKNNFILNSRNDVLGLPQSETPLKCDPPAPTHRTKCQCDGIARFYYSFNGLQLASGWPLLMTVYVSHSHTIDNSIVVVIVWCMFVNWPPTATAWAGMCVQVGNCCEPSNRVLPWKFTRNRIAIRQTIQFDQFDWRNDTRQSSVIKPMRLPVIGHGRWCWSTGLTWITITTAMMNWKMKNKKQNAQNVCCANLGCAIKSEWHSLARACDENNALVHVTITCHRSPPLNSSEAGIWNNEQSHFGSTPTKL